MRKPAHVVEERRRNLARLLEQSGYLPVGELCERFGISEATVRRDLAVLQREKRITRTYGGALADYNLRFPSFQQRRKDAGEAKRSIAEAAVGQIRRGDVCFLDTGTTLFAVAEALREKPLQALTIVTTNLPVAELLAEVETFAVYIPGGRFLKRQSVILGDPDILARSKWKFDVALMSAEGLDKRGLWNSQENVVLLQKAVIERAKRILFCIDSSKLGRSGAYFLSDWKSSFRLLTDAPPKKLQAVSKRVSAARVVTTAP